MPNGKLVGMSDRVFLTEYYPEGTDVYPLLVGVFGRLDVAMSRLISRAQEKNPDAGNSALWWAEYPNGRFLIREDRLVVFGRIRDIEIDAPVFPPMEK